MHNWSAYANSVCRCEVCRVDFRRYRAEYRARLAAAGVRSLHGTAHCRCLTCQGRRRNAPMRHNYATYASGRCRCGVCLADHARYRREYRARRKALGGGPLTGTGITHGLNGYVEDGCRCEVCRAAKSEQNRRERGTL